MTFNKLTPNFEVQNIKKTVDFYVNVLGFSLVMIVPETQDGIEQTIADGKEYVFAMVVKDKVELMFQESESFKQDLKFAKGLSIAASISFYMEVNEVDKLYNDLKNKVSEISELKTAWHGMREFYIKDINGYMLGFAEKVQ
ncbi:bleomycin resistance family protein [Ancylomarina salipaludis]|uniref:Bleomycin resistance family protein n=1 Tax=Ancylomarina salipaludis TaxID=2501299 RepID=A0A4Q1JMB8_9BACT|nr:VOC family protein [Ancylomarina salipaludis]RXQ94445.1 bleomycin resistance family protein [Ancylomarina salipaludis]